MEIKVAGQTPEVEVTREALEVKRPAKVKEIEMAQQEKQEEIEYEITVEVIEIRLSRGQRGGEEGCKVDPILKTPNFDNFCDQEVA